MSQHIIDLQDIKLSSVDDGVHLLEIAAKGLRILRTNKKVKEVEIWKAVKATGYKGEMFPHLNSEQREYLYNLKLNLYQYMELANLALSTLQPLIPFG